jgi:hypothetical protein
LFCYKYGLESYFAFPGIVVVVEVITTAVIGMPEIVKAVEKLMVETQYHSSVNFYSVYSLLICKFQKHDNSYPKHVTALLIHMIHAIITSCN